MAGILARTVLRACSQVEAASRCALGATGQALQAFDFKADDEEDDSQPLSKSPLKPPSYVGSRQISSALPPTVCRPRSLNPYQSWHGLFHSSAFCQEDDSRQAAEPESAPSSNGSAPNSSAIRDTKSLLRTATLTVLREQLRDHERAWVTLPELYRMCREAGTADNDKEAEQVVADLDKAGVLIQLRDKAFLRPEEIANHVLQALPAPLVDENDHRIQEFEKMQLEKKAIDLAARRYARRYLWIGWTALSLQTAFFFRLTFWELSWDVMEPITYFAAMTTGILGYAWFLFTRSEPSYSDAFTRFYHNKQEKVANERHFDLERYYRLQRQVRSFRKQQARSKRTADDDEDD